MKQFITQVSDFHKAFAQPIANIPTKIIAERYELRFDMFREENEEYIDESEENNIVGVVDAIGDMLYILCGTIVEHGLAEFVKPLKYKSSTKGIPHTITLGESLTFFENLRIGNEEYIKSCERLNDGPITEIIEPINNLINLISRLIESHNFGGQIENVFTEIHKSNMSKLSEDGKPIYREDGKILKGPNYFKPNLNKFCK